MPKFKVPLSLVDLSSKQLAQLVLDAVRRSESENHQNIHEYYKVLPPMVIHQIMDKSVELYVSFDYTDKVYWIQRGYYDQQRCILPRLGSMYTLQVVPNLVTSLDFTKLVRLGTLSAGAFAYFHQVLTECLERVPCLQFLNLKSPNSRTSLPSVAPHHLKLLGDKWWLRLAKDFSVQTKHFNLN